MMELQDALNKILELEGAIKEKDQTIDSLNIVKQEQESKIEGYANEITKLKENNMSLFLKVSQQIEQQENQLFQPEEPKKTATKSWDSFMSEW